MLDAERAAVYLNRSTLEGRLKIRRFELSVVRVLVPFCYCKVSQNMPHEGVKYFNLLQRVKAHAYQGLVEV